MEVQPTMLSSTQICQAWWGISIHPSFQSLLHLLGNQLLAQLPLPG
jgi:hypothetical protein